MILPICFYRQLKNQLYYSFAKCLSPVYVGFLFIIYLLIGCVESSLRHEGFSLLGACGGCPLVALRGLLTAVAALAGSRSCVRASGVVQCGPGSLGSQALERRLSSCGAQTQQLLHGAWDPPAPGTEPVSIALQGRFFTTESPRMPWLLLILRTFKKLMIIY